MKPIQNIGLYITSRRDDLDDCVEQICGFLESKKINYYFEETSYEQLPDHLHKDSYSTFTVAETAINEGKHTPIDLVLVVGGDGSFLRACQLFCHYDAPLTGINLGRLGFLTDISIDQLEPLLTPILQRKGHTEKRYFFEGTVASCTVYALNDIVIQTDNNVSIMDIEVRVGGALAFDLRCDGIIVASSTGSTAYGLSAGGPLLHPDVQGLVLVPLAAHTLSARPCVIPDDKPLQIRETSKAQVAKVIVDGVPKGILPADQPFSIRKSSRSITLVHPPGYDYFAACRQKLGWHSASH